MTKKIIITGNNGYIGNHLENKLKDEGHQIERLSVKNTLWKSMSFENFDIIIHTAGLVHNSQPNAKLEDYLKINMQLTYELAKKAKSEGVKQFVFLSTMSVYGEEGSLTHIIEIDSDTNVNPLNNYGISKRMAERKLLSIETKNFRVSILRPPMVYGKDSPGNFSKLKKLSTMIPIVPKIVNVRSAIYINHLTQYISEIIQKNLSGIFHPQDNFKFETYKVIKEIRNQMGKKTIYIYVPKFLFPLLNKISVLRKLYGSLIYRFDYGHNSKKIRTNQKSFEDVMYEIIKE